MVQDEGIELDLRKSAQILNKACRHASFSALEKPIHLGQGSLPADISKEVDRLREKLSGIDRDYIVYNTLRRYEDNWFFHAMRNTMILSFFGWKHYTTLPLENGLFYFIADALALRIDRSFQHQDTTGCIYDFLTEKTAVDLGMKMGYICEACQKRVGKIADESERARNLFSDLVAILEITASYSRWGKSVLDFERDISIKHLDWSTFENEVAQLYRILGAKVKQNVSLAGFQTDIYVEEETPSKQKLRVAVECKLHKAKVGNLMVNDFARIVETLKEAKFVDKGVIVSYSGFSKDAHLVSEKTGIELLTLEDLKQAVSIKKSILMPSLEKSTLEFIESKKELPEERRAKSPEIFAIMPFISEFDDVYFLGIHEVVTSLGYSCKRVDEIEFVGDIVSKIYESITNAKIIIGEVSLQTPNVYYELGYAHALKKPVILLTKDLSSAPFDLRGQNHIVYKNIVDLRKKLKDRLSSILPSSPS